MARVEAGRLVPWLKSGSCWYVRGIVSGPILQEEPTLLADTIGWGVWEEEKSQE